MRTRTLLLLAVACGVAILGAGAAFFVKLAGQDDGARPVHVGTAITVGDLDVLVDSFVERGQRFDVLVELGGVDDPDAVSGFRLVTPNGAAVADATSATDPPSCGAVTLEARRCTLSFPLPDEAGTTRVLQLRRGEEQAWWDLVTA